MNKIYVGLIASLLIFGGCAWLSYQALSPLFTPTSELTVVRFDWLGLPLVGIFSFTVFSIVLVFGYVHALIQRQVIMRTTKFLMYPMIVGAIIGLGVNYANYFFVIKPNNMIECPLKIGYKKNLLRDYVFDTSLCKKR